MNALELKVPPALVGLLIAGLMWWLARVTPVIELSMALRTVSGLVVLVAGVIIVVAGVLSFRRARTTVNPLSPESSTSLVQCGIYRWTRNPMYLGFALMLLAWSLWLAAPVTLTGPLLFVAWMNRFQIRPEERALRELFGAEFDAYGERVRRWI